MTYSQKELTQYQKILTLMVRDKTGKWFLPQDFMHDHLGKYFVGYEASARLSELAKKYPEMIENQHQGKYIARRLRINEIAKWLYLLPKDLRQVIHRAGLTKNLPHRQRAVTASSKDAELKVSIKKKAKPEPRKTIKLEATYKGRNRDIGFDKGKAYKLEIEPLVIGKPVTMIKPRLRVYDDLKKFKKEWRTV